MITHLERFIEQDGNVMPAYTEENAPRFEHLEDVGHVATLDVIDTDDYKDAVEADEKAAAEREAEAARVAKAAAEQAERERLGLTDEDLYADWKRRKEETKAEADALRADRDRSAQAAPSGPEQRNNARAAVREHYRRVTKQIKDGNRGPRSTEPSFTPQQRSKSKKAPNPNQLQLLG